jgi:2-dehydro-3-deoxyphosphogalactonate aldolase
MNMFRTILKSTGLIGIFRGLVPEDVDPIASAAIENGLRIIEVPLNSPRPFDSIERLATIVHADVIVGAGTVTTTQEVESVAAAGGQLIVTPYARVDVVLKAKKLGLIVVPGAMTPTEIAAMADCGADAVKVFPTDIIPPAGVKALRSVLPRDLLLIPVGGVTLDNMEPYVEAGADGFGLGSALYRAGDHPDSVARKTALFINHMKFLLRTET